MLGGSCREAILCHRDCVPVLSTEGLEIIWNFQNARGLDMCVTAYSYNVVRNANDLRFLERLRQSIY